LRAFSPDEFQEHDPSEQRQPVKVAIEPLVLAQNVPREYQQETDTSGSGFCHHQIKKSTGPNGTPEG